MKIEFHCENEAIAKHFPPVPAAQMLPDWYKKMPFYIGGKKLNDARELMQDRAKQPETIRACMPVKDYITSGYMIRMHSDLVVTPEKNEDNMDWWWSSPFAKCDGHPYEQCPIRINDRENTYFKIILPWVIKTPPGYSCYFYQPEFFFNKNLQLFPGIVDTDTHENCIGLPGIVLSEKTFTIKAGDPLMIVFPFKRESWTHEVLVRKEKPNATWLFMQNGYRKLFHRPKSFK